MRWQNNPTVTYLCFLTFLLWDSEQHQKYMTDLIITESSLDIDNTQLNSDHSFSSGLGEKQCSNKEREKQFFKVWSSLWTSHLHCCLESTSPHPYLPLFWCTVKFLHSVTVLVTFSTSLVSIIRG